MRICPNCGKGMEWGKEIINEEIKYYWRCSWCGYRGEDIIEV